MHGRFAAGLLVAESKKTLERGAVYKFEKKGGEAEGSGERPKSAHRRAKRPLRRSPQSFFLT